MEGHTPHQEFGGSDEIVRPRHAYSRSQGFDGNHDTNADHVCHGQADGRGSQAPSYLRASSYTAHVRSGSGVAWDGRISESANHSPSSSPPQSPVLRSNRPRPLSASSAPGHFIGRPAVLADRWSYDRTRMPSPPPWPHGSRPDTPMSEHEAPETAFSRPASTFTESRLSSRPQSILLSASTDVGYFQTPSTPTLRVMPSPPDVVRESQPLSQDSNRHSYHLLTSEEMEMLSRPPPLQPPMSAPSLPSSSPGSSTPNPTGKLLCLDVKQTRQRHARPRDSNEDAKNRPGCCGLCEISTFRMVSGKFGAWFMGMAIPATFGAVVGCIVSITTGCR